MSQRPEPATQRDVHAAKVGYSNRMALCFSQGSNHR
jgi:hypothetical protein